MKHVKLYEEFVTEAKMSKEKIEDMIWSLENEVKSWHPSNDSKKKAMLDKLKKDLSKFESVVTEARAPKTKEELTLALDNAYSKLNKYNTKYYEISKAPGGGSWSSNSKEGKQALKYKKMANDQQSNIWKWTDKLRNLGFEYNTNESVVTESDINDPVLMAFRAMKSTMAAKKAIAALDKKKRVYGKQRDALEDQLWDIANELKDLTSERSQLYTDMEAEAGEKGTEWSDDDANRYGEELNTIEDRIDALKTKRRQIEDRLSY